jgi:hypothetical protein
VPKKEKMKNKAACPCYCLIIILVVSLVFTSCLKQNIVENELQIIQNIDKTIHQWHDAAAQADFDTYFELMSDEAVFMGTDATERWDKKAFQAYAKPHFDKGKAWTFKTIERNIVVDSLQQIAWFDELLDTSFKICRGSGVLKKQGNYWKISHYVLSMTVPNENSKQVVALKDVIETSFIQKKSSKK